MVDSRAGRRAAVSIQPGIGRGRRAGDVEPRTQEPMQAPGGTFGVSQRLRQLYHAHVEETLRLLRRRPCFSTLVVDYAETLAHPERTARRLHRFLGARLDVTRAAAAADSGLYRNRGTAAGA